MKGSARHRWCKFATYEVRGFLPKQLVIMDIHPLCALTVDGLSPSSSQCVETTDLVTRSKFGIESVCRLPEISGTHTHTHTHTDRPTPITPCACARAC